MKCRVDDFELENGQTRSPRIAFEHEWFDGSGVPIGYGDLDHGDFTRISQVIKPGEWFLTLDINAVLRIGRTPTMDKLIMHASFAVTHGELYHLDPGAPSSLVAVDYCGTAFTVVSSDMLRKLMTK